MTDERSGWDRHRRDQLRRWMKATPAQRLAALEELIATVRSVSPKAADAGDGMRTTPPRQAG